VSSTLENLEISGNFFNPGKLREISGKNYFTLEVFV